MPGYVDPLTEPERKPTPPMGSYIDPLEGREDDTEDEDNDEDGGAEGAVGALDAGGDDEESGEDEGLDDAIGEDEEDAPAAGEGVHAGGGEGTCGAGGCGQDNFFGGFCWPHLQQHLMRLRHQRGLHPKRPKEERPASYVNPGQEGHEERGPEAGGAVRESSGYWDPLVAC